MPRAIARVQGTKLSEEGPILVTHWGMSGPGILKLSAWGARELATRNYHFTTQINWIGEPNEDKARHALDLAMSDIARKNWETHVLGPSEKILGLPPQSSGL